MATTQDQVISNGSHDEEKGLYRTTTGVTMSPELFEKVIMHIHLFGYVITDPA